MTTCGRWLAGPALAALAGLAVAVAGSGLARADADDCATPPEMTDTDIKLPHFADRLAAHKPATIVAIGGASTMGKAAGSSDLSYPHRLGQDLSQDYPKDKIAVVNKGVPMQSAKDMFERFPTDVFAQEPVLVVWEVGIVDAVRGTDVDEFTGTLQDGIDALKNKAIDTILVDMQFSPNSATVINFDAYLQALHRVGDLADAYVFPRFEMMRYWSEQNVFNFDDVAEADRAKLAARVYDCLGRKMAGIIHRAVP
ncbi:MAG TPA: SGNH/GDSL hydrolase family protein [Stellaceae bacterium]|jgi:acyl-CoA thioesterase-1|nr:SGNH/GDSL hydrolase family protein [Stellaceae bacterium]